jgi:DNA-binding CsgD family transcriptional regulator
LGRSGLRRSFGCSGKCGRMTQRASNRPFLCSCSRERGGSAERDRLVYLSVYIPMAATKRTKHERERDRGEISRLYLAGKTQREIAETLGLSQAMISYDLTVIQERWQAARNRELDDVRATELARLAFIFREAMAAWEQSKRDSVTTMIGESRTQTIIRNRDGNPRFLLAAMEAIQLRCALLGLVDGRGADLMRRLAGHGESNVIITNGV